MDVTVHRTFLPHDDPDASLAFYRDASASRSAMTSDTTECAGSRSAPSAADLGIILATADFDGLFERVEASDAEALQELR